jgi:hypothetical protein
LRFKGRVVKSMGAKKRWINIQRRLKIVE